MTNIGEMSCAVSRIEKADVLRGKFYDEAENDRNQLDRWTHQEWKDGMVHRSSRWRQFKDAMVLSGLFVGSGVLFGLAVYGAVCLIRAAL